jgi:hypothetical protein
VTRNIAIGLLAITAFAALGCEAPEEPTKFQTLDAVSTYGPVDKPGSETEVWSVSASWTDVDTAPARDAGMAWPADSGMDWEQKYEAWVQGLETTTRVDGGATFSLETPYGDRTLPAPFLDCGEVAMLLRAAFASWYHLPFYMTGWDAELRKPIYAGHMGFVFGDGSGHPGYPRFRVAYADHEGSWYPGDAWPEDAKLRTKRLGDDDRNVFLEDEEGEVAGAGAYFDELFLNKRVGHFVRRMMLSYGSMHLADPSNMIHVRADAMRAGDTLLRRQKKYGSGHTVPVLHVTHPVEGKTAVHVASGNVPRRQPKWEDTAESRWRFTNNQYGGHGENSKGQEYAKLGGGLRRWRTASKKGARWRNLVLPRNEAERIDEGDYETLAARVDHFGEILMQGTPSEQIEVAKVQIEDARAHLRKYPASCSARTNREEAFDLIYDINANHFDKTHADVDAELRTLEDYVFAELTYEVSKTCCWNATTTEMANVVLSYAEAEQAEAEANEMCVTPTVFRAEEAETDGYARWRSYADSIGQGAAWVVWSDDEACGLGDVSEDTLADWGASPWCE